MWLRRGVSAQPYRDGVLRDIPAGAKPRGVRQKRLLEESRGLRNLCGCEVQRAYDIRLFVTVMGMYRLDACRRAVRTCRPQASLAHSMDMPGW